MNTKYRSVMIGALLAILSSVAQAVQTIKWDKTVIPVELIVGVEQMIHFQGPATVGLPPTLANADVFRHLFASNTAYWKALAPLKTERIKVRLDNTGEFLLFDVSAKTLKRPPKTLEPLSVVVPSTTQNDPLREHPQAEEDSVTLFDL